MASQGMKLGTNERNASRGRYETPSSVVDLCCCPSLPLAVPRQVQMASDTLKLYISSNGGT